jgi:hypothetical protein
MRYWLTLLSSSFSFHLTVDRPEPILLTHLEPDPQARRGVPLLTLGRSSSNQPDRASVTFQIWSLCVLF